ncbi:hypothetical protein CUJ86_05265 [Methanofollis fontis]|uniref:DUF7123 domain-containing protein n=1 Tax=Methanofollis fontis TaxID=2052832 RepID=A0A483CS38_9EURY|nr:hypothetical protein CUJ86_05265 [Methanofollis fontis]
MTALPVAGKDHYTRVQRKILCYLTDLAANGRCYIKARHVASDLGLTAKEVGMNLSILSESCTSLEILKWSNGNGTTWAISRRQI